ncbi:hypothetical protein [Selenomonas ruminantium]|uniref:hypothetical protein n=1 Tax=Selenomonas ruminantium TaxID=971 RepID=UPI0012D323F6|nr:hypothetical protein [Selenomonas ruminantium]
MLVKMISLGFKNQHDRPIGLVMWISKHGGFMKDLVDRYRNKVILLIYGVLTLPIFYGRIANGLDPSWSYALNKMIGLENIKFGRDVVFTYGPMGFLCAPEYLNDCFKFAAIIFIMLFVGQMVVFYKCYLNKSNNISLYIALITMFLGNILVSADIFIQYCILLSLLALWKDINNNFTAIYFTFAVTIAFFYKWSVTIGILASICIFILAKLYLREFRRLWLFLLPIITSILCYMLYNPSVSDFIRYVYGSWQVAVGFNTAMSVDLNDAYAAWMFLLILLYSILLLMQLYCRDINNFIAMMLLAPVMFMSYKHGYVRADGHVIHACSELLMEFAILILVFNFRDIYDGVVKKRKKEITQAGIIMGIFLVMFFNYEMDIKPLDSLRNRIHNIPTAVYTIRESQFKKNVAGLDRIPEEFVKEIGTSSFTSFPWEISFIEPAGEMSKQFIPLFGLQAYSIYTSYLDAHTAEWIADKNKPEYIIFKLDTIDGRIPLMEVPATWKVIQDNYHISKYDKATGYCLLKRDDTLAGVRTGNIRSEEINKNAVIFADDCDEIRLKANLSKKGQIVKTIWKIPEVKATITYSDGTERTGRVILDNLRNGITVNGMPYDYDTLYDSINSDGTSAKIKSIILHGDGLKYYTDMISVERVYYDSHKKADISYLRPIKKEYLDIDGLVKGDNKEIHLALDHKSLEPFISLNGWAYIGENLSEYLCFVKIGDSYYKCHKTDRDDVIKTFSLSGSNKLGFNIKLPIREKDLELLFVTSGKYYEVKVPAK